PPPPAPAPKTRCVVPNVKGKTVAVARKAIVRGHCAVGRITRVPSTRKMKNRVVGQSSSPGRRLAERARINLKIGTGPRRK
ncbi:MAG: PASTA domain-containing protein, partial [Actinomycetota bacterium]|nr:PASTA domain-containing protein [Actinomycetota bacterium]